MSAVFDRIPDFTASDRSAQRGTAPVALRGVLLAVCAASMAVAFHAGDPSTALQADPELAQLLRGMAAIKGLMVVAAIAVLLWRFGHPVGPRLATAYIVGAGLLAGATVLIWQLTLLLPAAAAFHAGLFLLLIIAWRGDGDLRAARG